jgi:hypothetical protein
MVKDGGCDECNRGVFRFSPPRAGHPSRESKGVPNNEEVEVDEKTGNASTRQAKVLHSKAILNRRRWRL